jgi:hypothetical protein
VFQAFVDADRDRNRQSVAASADGCADEGGESGIDQGVAAHDHEAAIEFGIALGMMNAIDFAPCHRLPARFRLCLLIAEDVPHFFSSSAALWSSSRLRALSVPAGSQLYTPDEFRDCRRRRFLA